MLSANFALLLEQIIASPLKAVVDAQSESAKATVNFLFSLMEEDGEKVVPKSVVVAYQQAFLDPDSGKVKQVEQRIGVPLVTLVPIPYISVDEAEIEFDAKVVAAGPSAEKGAVPIYAVYAGRLTSRVDVSGELHLKIKARRSDIPEGIARMITVLANSQNISAEE
nr:DUF2589 domain-containing protein [Archaeoglobus neptunius]